jgi:hypothetical protein
MRVRKSCLHPARGGLRCFRLFRGFNGCRQDAKPADNKDTMQQLLAEVRMLRQAFEAVQRINVDTYRSQLLVDRVRASRDEMRRLNGSLNDTREMLRRTQQTIPTAAERCEDVWRRNCNWRLTRRNARSLSSN